MDGKQWSCRCGAHLGLVQADRAGTPQLMVYRHAVDLSAEAPAEVETLGPVTGMFAVECDACGAVKVWWPSAQAVVTLLERLEPQGKRAVKMYLAE